MDQQDQAAIERLFERMKDFEQSAPERDAEAERFIADRLRRQPGAAYYMAQTVVAQQQALESAEARIAELERGGAAGRPASPGPWSRQQPHQAGGGFLAGAAQTAAGVAGGVLLANLLGGLFGGDQAAAEEAPAEEDPGGFGDIDF
ncbi:MAG: DUF2076 domain-containing protein, partial [Alphaproteobacteria bacterium]